MIQFIYFYLRLPIKHLCRHTQRRYFDHSKNRANLLAKQRQITQKKKVMNEKFHSFRFFCHIWERCTCSLYRLLKLYNGRRHSHTKKVVFLITTSDNNNFWVENPWVELYCTWIFFFMNEWDFCYHSGWLRQLFICFDVMLDVDVDGGMLIVFDWLPIMVFSFS